MFDTTIDDIILVHKAIFDMKKFDTVYTNGRNMDGFVYCISGAAEWIYKDNTTIINKGDVIYLPPSSKYSVKAKGQPFLHYTANFHLSRPISEAPVQLTDTHRYQRLFEQLCNAWKNKTNGFRLKSKAVLYEIIYVFLNDISFSGINTANYEKIVPALDYMNNQPSKTVPTKLLAEICNISETHFRRLFKEIYGKSPTEYQLDIKLLKAEDLLETGLYTVAEISEKCGFTDANYFSRLFKSRKGVSPLNYRKGR